VARNMLARFGLPRLALFKVGLVLIGSYPLLRFSHRAHHGAGHGGHSADLRFSGGALVGGVRVYSLTATGHVEIARLTPSRVWECRNPPRLLGS